MGKIGKLLMFLLYGGVEGFKVYVGCNDKGIFVLCLCSWFLKLGNLEKII